MAGRRKYKRPTREQLRAMTPQERLEHTRALERERSARYYRRHIASTTKAERRARAEELTTALFDWSRLLPHIERLPSGCWLWTGPFRSVFGDVRPWARAGALGGMRADHIVCCLSRGRPPPKCFVSRTCATVGCVSPTHLVWSNRAVETAKNRRRHVESEELAGRVE